MSWHHPGSWCVADSELWVEAGALALGVIGDFWVYILSWARRLVCLQHKEYSFLLPSSSGTMRIDGLLTARRQPPMLNTVLAQSHVIPLLGVPCI